MKFDLNIGNYNKQELQEIFELPANYDMFVLDNTEEQFRNTITVDQSIDTNMKKQILSFISAAKKMLSADVRSDIIKRVEASNIYNTDISLKPSQTTDAGNTFIIDKPITPYAQSFPSEFYSGKINPLRKRVITQNLNIDTSFRDNYYTSTSSNFHFDLPVKFSNIMDIQLASFEMPTTFYTISKQLGNNFFTLRTEDVDGNDTSIFVVITIPNGDYTNADLISYLNNYITTVLVGTPFASISFIQNNTNNSGSGEMVVQSSTFTKFTLDFQTNSQGYPDTGTPLPLKFGWLIGFRAGKYFNKSSYVSEGIINLTGLSYLFLVVNDYNNNVNNGFYSAFNNSILNNNILARISIIKTNPTQNFDLVNQNNLSIITSPRQYFGPVDIQKLHIQLLDGYGRIIDLNNMDYSFCLTFHAVYDL